MDGQIIATDKAICSALSPMHLGVFEGIRAYAQGSVSSRGKISVFRWHDHIKRLWRSARIMGIEIPYSKDQLLQALREVVEANRFDSNVYIAPRVWPKTYIADGMTEREVYTLLRVSPIETRLEQGNKEFEAKYRTNVSSWRRVSSDSLPPQNKALANYANSRLAELEARRLGFDNCLFLDSRGLVSEGAGESFICVKDDALITPPISASVLESITRDSLLATAKEDLGLRVEQRDISRVELYGMDEAFLCGTFSEVRPVSSIDDIEIGTDYPGPVTRKVASQFGSVVSGTEPRRTTWLTPL